MTGKERQRALAREKVQRQMQRRAAQAQRRRTVRNALAGVLAIVVVLAVGAYLVIAFNVFGGGNGAKDTLAQAQNNKTPQPQPTTAFCTYTQPQPGTGGVVPRKVSPPSINGIPRSGTATVLLHTNRGDITLTLDQKSTPCTAHNFLSLTAQHYFDQTVCHRLTTSGLYVLQCGDPSGTGSGGPGYVFPDENLGSLAKGKNSGGGAITYPAGSVAMANSGPNTNGSQFFMVYRDSALPPSYTLFGKVTSGLDVIKKIAAAGVKGGGTDGAPKQPVKILSAKILKGSPGTVPSAAPSATPSPSHS